jgi:hypothetical protein
MYLSNTILGLGHRKMFSPTSEGTSERSIGIIKNKSKFISAFNDFFWPKLIIPK